ncbi:MAG: hypothetical protein V4516_14200 [Pseudomonadota bacterium]
MLEFLPLEVRQGLEAARRRDLRARSRLRVHVDDAVYPVLRSWPGGFALEAEHAPHLRGLVDLYDGTRHLMQCLIVASSVEGGEVICDFKRATPITDRAALDYLRDANAPVAYLPKA